MTFNIKQFIMGILPASYFIWTDQFTGACIILFLLIVLDTITGMRAGTSYRVRAYAVNSEGTGYGTTVTVKTLGSRFITKIIIM